LTCIKTAPPRRRLSDYGALPIRLPILVEINDDTVADPMDLVGGRGID
jgi:hypothetical protein